MKQTIFNSSSRDEVILRVKKLGSESRGKWGKLTAAQMIRHLAEACRMAFDEIEVKDRSNWFTRSIAKWLFLKNVKPPGREKGNIKTLPEVDVVALQLPVADIETERQNYFKMLERMSTTETLSNHHPLFGKMSHADWGYLTYAHADYHLTQFNV